jgi:excisionase family DNA binding protein
VPVPAATGLALTSVSRLWDVKGLCSFLNVSKSQVFKLIAEAGLPHVHIGGNLRFVPESIQDWVLEREMVREQTHDAVRRAVTHISGRDRLRGQVPPPGQPHGTTERLKAINGSH